MICKFEEQFGGGVSRCAKITIQFHMIGLVDAEYFCGYTGLIQHSPETVGLCGSVRVIGNMKD